MTPGGEAAGVRAFCNATVPHSLNVLISDTKGLHRVGMPLLRVRSERRSAGADSVSRLSDYELTSFSFCPQRITVTREASESSERESEESASGYFSTSAS